MLGGLKVWLHDSLTNACEQGRQFIASMIGRMVDKSTISQTDAASATARLVVAQTLADLKACDVVIEAVVEDLTVKQSAFRDLEKVVPENCILASNTSSLSITTIASTCARPERVAGMHFFNPVPLMRLVEIIKGVRTADDVAETLIALARQMGREPVQVANAPGFLVNRIGRGYTIETVHVVSEGIADFVTVDRIMRDAVGFRMGPFELMDLTGLDVTHPATEQIFQQFYGKPRFRPSGLMQARTQAGILGRKTKRVFYSYDAQAKTEPSPRETSRGKPSTAPPVWVSRAEPLGHATVCEMLSETGFPIKTDSRPSSQALCLVTAVGADNTSTSLSQDLDSSPTVAIDTLFGLGKRVTLMTNPKTSQASIDAAAHMVSEAGRAVSIIRDSPGFIAQRIIAMMRHYRR